MIFLNVFTVGWQRKNKKKNLPAGILLVEHIALCTRMLTEYKKKNQKKLSSEIISTSVILVCLLNYLAAFPFFPLPAWIIYAMIEQEE